MKPNPGGVITGEEIIDRENEMDSIWNALKNQSVVLMSERRVGKTSVLRKMEVNPKDGWSPILCFVEGKWHPIEFVEGLYDTLLAKGMLENRFNNLKKLYKKYVDGDQIGSWKFPHIKENWKKLLESMIDDIISSDQKILLMFDELPLMLSHFIQSNEYGPHVGMEFLDIFRELRNKCEATKKIAFIFCGSIGIHLIIKDLKINYGYTADPINNMKIITINSMSDNGAKLLCEKLSEDEQFEFDDKDNIHEYICKNTDNLPFYIQHVFAHFYDKKEMHITKNVVDEAIDFLVNDPKDEGFFRHYTDRIKTYYDEESKKIALLILDYACKKSDYWVEDDIINTVNSNMVIDKEIIKETIDLIWSDHYVMRKIENDKRQYKFKYSILQKWWRVNRG